MVFSLSSVIKSILLLDLQGHPIHKIHFPLPDQVGHQWMAMGMVTHRVLHLITILHQCSALHLKQMLLPHIQVSLEDVFCIMCIIGGRTLNMV